MHCSISALKEQINALRFSRLRFLQQFKDRWRVIQSQKSIQIVRRFVGRDKIPRFHVGVIFAFFRCLTVIDDPVRQENPDGLRIYRRSD